MTCPVLKCNTLKNTINCAEYDTTASQFNVQLCSNKTLTCAITGVDIANVDIPCKEPVEVLNRLDKKKCDKPEQCASGVCENQACVGKKVNEACDQDNKCAINLRCVNSQCKELIKIGSPCTDNNECEIGAVCNSLTCVAIYSFADGTVATNTKACQSGKTHTTNDNKLVCVTTEKKEEKCKTENKCTYTVTGESSQQFTAEYSEPCECSYAAKDTLYCPLDTKNSDYKNNINALKAVKNVHILERNSIDRKISNAANVKFTGVDKCVLDLFNTSSFLQLSFVALIGLFLF